MSTFSITTKAGDQGTTGLLDNQRVAKYDLRPEAYGTLDEANAFIGLARAKTDLPIVQEIIYAVQNHLYLINSELACPVEHLVLLKRRISDQELQVLEKYSSDLEQKLNLPRKFVLYGATDVSACLDVARTVLRRAERRVVELDSQEKIENKVMLPYLNRLSDALFILARYEEFAHGVPYQHPEVS